MMNRVALFLAACLLAGAGGVIGSIVGHATGAQGVMIGGVVGGLLGAIASSFLARRRRWIVPAQLRGTAIGASLGFLAAAGVATHTLNSPVGPVLSTLLVGIGALAGAATHRDHVI
jgi:uncharacterized membrane protein (UPF0136 family)